MGCSRYGNLGRMHVILNVEPLEEVDCFKYMGLQVAADGGCGTHNELGVYSVGSTEKYAE